MNLQDLEATARALVAPRKGILAADESFGTMEKRLVSIGASSTEESRRAWRQLLFTASGIGDYISGVILFDETIRQRADDGRSLVEVLSSHDVIPGIKVDMGTTALAGSPTEKMTEGLDGLRERLKEYRDLGARFTKWRGVIAIGDGLPTPYCIDVNAHALARYAALSQEAGLTPLVEPEVLMDGDHDIDRCFVVTEATLRRVFAALADQGVVYEAMLLKPNMVLSAKDAAQRAGPEEVAEATIRCFRRCVPAGGARRRLPVRRSERRRGHAQPGRHKSARRHCAVAAQLLLRAGASDHASPDVGRRPGQRPTGAGSVPPPR